MRRGRGSVSTQGEFGQLGRSFDVMAEEIQRRQEESRRMREILRHSAEKAENEKSKTEAIIAAIGEGISIQDRQFRIIYQNEAQRKLTGDQLGKLCYEVYETKDSVCEGCPMAETYRDGGIHSVERRAENAYGEIYIEITTSPVRDSTGDIVAGVELVRDITERKLAEAEKEKLQAQLQQAMKMEAVGRLAGGVAHDFNNLLTVITGYSELLLQKIGKESPMHGNVEEIKRAGERAASLTQQLLAFSRKQIIEPRFHLDSLVAEMHKMLTRLIGENIALQATTGKSLGSVKVDPGQFQQILMNLVVNARDAMPDGGKIVIETANVDLDEGYCALHPYVTPGGS